MMPATGPEQISSLAAARFGGSGSNVEVLDVYAQTNGFDQPTDTNPEIGQVIAIGIHYRVSSADGTQNIDSLTTFEMGTRQPEAFTPQPDGLITREEVFHNLESDITNIP